MDRIICHWSEGNYQANDTDLQAYHILIEGDGTVRFGTHTIDDNVETSDRDYAAHTLNCNTRSIGVACCCMRDCQERPFNAGPRPLKREQWEQMARVVAELCDFYNIPVTPRTVLGHGEVQNQLRIRQRGKWDPMVLPWDPRPFDPDRPETHGAGLALRTAVQAHLDALRSGIAPASTPARISTPVPVAPGGATVTPVPMPDTFNLRSRLFSGNAALEAVADGHRVLRATGSPVAGVELVQDALNRLAVFAPQYRVETGNHRGFFGQRTERAISAFQEDMHLEVDGVIGEETIRAMDEAIATIERGGNPPVGNTVSIGTARTVYVPPTASSGVLQGISFANADASKGRQFFDIYAAADRDPRLAKGDPSNCRALLQFPDGTWFFDAKMAICADGSPRAREIDPASGLTRTAFTYPEMQNAHFDAERVPYIVLPGGNDEKGVPGFAKALGIGPRDLAVVVNGHKVTPAFYGEVGPWYRLGEAAIKVHEELPVRSPWTSPARTRIRNASVEREVLYFIFPKTALKRTANMTPEEWLDETCRAAIDRWNQFCRTQQPLVSGSAAGVGPINGGGTPPSGPSGPASPAGNRGVEPEPAEVA